MSTFSFLFLQTQFLVGGVCLKDFIEAQKLEHVQQLEAEKHARDKQKKETLLQETRWEKNKNVLKLFCELSGMALNPQHQQD